MKLYFAQPDGRHGVFRGLKYPMDIPSAARWFPNCWVPMSGNSSFAPTPAARDTPEIVESGVPKGSTRLDRAGFFPTAKFLPTTSTPEAVQASPQMAQANQIEARLVLGSLAMPPTLQNLPLTRRALVLSDCEGTKTPVHPGNRPSLAAHDVLIEVHDLVDITISSRFARCLSSHP